MTRTRCGSTETPLRITIVRSAEQVRARRPANRSFSDTQIVTEVNRLTRRSTHR